jgi:hypothetical protein
MNAFHDAAYDKAAHTATVAAQMRPAEGERNGLAVSRIGDVLALRIF